ncbi:MAG: 4'-phosphopantetheinyl transferase superfamily protein [Lysobacteraceae bacterium]|nr:MAG: 4'-phosphopantetheinyl transferase superfamily protein [Xanthomonadaceae bacterium]
MRCFPSQRALKVDSCPRRPSSFCCSRHRPSQPHRNDLHLVHRLTASARHRRGSIADAWAHDQIYRQNSEAASNLPLAETIAYAAWPLRLKRRQLVNTLRIGPVECAWWPYRRGENAQTRVRQWLAEALGIAQSALILRRDPYGRPRLDGKPGGHDVNWSHSGEWLIAAYVVGAAVGIDIEWLRPRPKALALAQRFFVAEETAALAAEVADAQDLEQRFTRLWCAKEAVLKAHGRGLSFGLDKLRFTVVEEDRTPQLLACDSALGLPEDWRIHAWTPVPGYLATVAWTERNLVPRSAAGAGNVLAIDQTSAR